MIRNSVPLYYEVENHGTTSTSLINFENSQQVFNLNNKDDEDEKEVQTNGLQQPVTQSTSTNFSHLNEPFYFNDNQHYHE